MMDENVSKQVEQFAARSTDHVNKIKTLPPGYQSKKDAIYNYQNKEESPQRFKNQQLGQANRERVCIRCGGKYPHANECPAYREECHKCGKMGNYARLCRNGYRSEGRSFCPQGRKAQFSGRRFNRQDPRPEETVQRLEEPRRRFADEDDPNEDYIYSLGRSSKIPAVHVSI
jgi:hypothetical protein